MVQIAYYLMVKQRTEGGVIHKKPEQLHFQHLQALKLPKMLQAASSLNCLELKSMFLQAF